MNNNMDKAALLEAAKKQNEREKQLTTLLGKGDIRALSLVGGNVTEKTFNDAVNENMQLFGTSREEAVKDVIKEFKLLGVDLSHLANN
jgi:transcriptional regulator of nitric oxide reductase